MQNILARKNLATLVDFACSSVLLGFDYDGTLVPKAPSLARARMRATTSATKPAPARRLPTLFRALSNVRPLGGDQAIDLILRDGPDKGVALQKARRALGCETAIDVGDDDTDENAFASAAPVHLLAIRVGPAKVSRARFCIKAQADIDSLLHKVLALRTRRAHC